MQFEILETENFLLRKINPDVHRYVHTHYGHDELRKFFALSTEKSFEREMRMFSGGLTTFNKSFLWFHLLDKANGEHVGWCGYHTWYTEHARAEIGYGFYDDRYKAKGLMTEVMRHVLTFGFEQMKLNRVEALIADYNIPSIRLVEKFGFQKEGILREHYFVDGVAEDSVMYGLTRNDWQHRFL